ncbi:MAG: hypothetical protein K2O03_14465 [Lachnospiraceae bacterium]|nr:hypothetical protein [Lachnospiraceae bacterium]
MRKKIMLAAAAAASAVMLTGCLAKTYPLTEEEQNIIAEYAAGVLLRNDENYTQKLVSPTPTPSPEPTPGPTSAPVTDGKGENHNQTGKTDNVVLESNATLSEVYGLEGLSVEYDGYESSSVLEENSGYIVRAGQGKMLMKVRFVLTNTAGIEQVFDFTGQDIRYRLEFGGKSDIQAKITGFEEDMLYRNVTLAAGESCEGCVVFEVQEMEEPIEGRVVVSRGDAYTAIVTLE